MNKKLLLVTLLCVTNYTIPAEDNSKKRKPNSPQTSSPKRRKLNASALNAQLIEAAQNGNEDEIKKLLANGADVNIQSQNGRTALMVAAEYGNTYCAQALLAAPGIDVNAQNEWGWTALMVAARRGDMLCVQSLIAFPGVNINVQSPWGETALIAAVQTCHTLCVKLLLAAPGIDVNAKSQNEQTALMLAQKKGHQAIVDLLTDK